MNLPTKITVTRIFMIPLIIASYCCQQLWDYMFIVTCALFFVASVTDFLDGYIARKYNMVTSLGKFLDPIADKVLVVTGIFIVVHAGYLSIPYLAMVCAIIIMAREFIIGLFRQMAALKNYVLAADRLGKYKTFATLFAIGGLMLVPVGNFANNNAKMFGVVTEYFGLIMLVIATILTIVSGINYIIKGKGLLKDNKTQEETEITPVDEKTEK